MHLNIILAWIGGIVSTALIWVLRTRLEVWKSDRLAARKSRSQELKQTAATDRATYCERITVLVRDHLAAFIRSDKWWRDEVDLLRLLTNLENGGACSFVDESVETLWVWLVEVSVDCARRRLDGTITSVDIQTYNAIRNRWLDEAKRSFGPLPEITPLTYLQGASASYLDSRAA